MTFVTLDEKLSCVGIYQNGELHFKQLPTDLDRTWKYIPYLEKEKIEYAYLYCEGKEMTEVCPEHLKNDWQAYNKKLGAFVKSFKEAKIDFDDNCIYDLIPKQFLLEFCDLKSKIIDNVFLTYKKPVNYDFSLELEKVLDSIKRQELKIDLKSLEKRRYEEQVRNFIKNTANWTKNVDFNQFGSKTGRLTTRPHTFPILNLNSEYRSSIKPSNDFFLELDFNAAELRVLIALAGQKQPEGDLHDWNAKRLNTTREEIKKESFAWLYGSSKVDGTKFDEIFLTKDVLKKYYDGETVKNYFGREIPSDDFHALNYLCQSTTSDMVQRQVIKVHNFLKGKQSKIGFIVHDSLLIDVCNSESGICNEIVNIFSNSEFGLLPVRTSLGRDYGSLAKIK